MLPATSRFAVVISLVAIGQLGLSTAQAADKSGQHNAAPESSVIAQTGHAEGITALAFSPDGMSAVSGGYDGTTILWDLVAGLQVRQFKGQTDIAWAVAISPDGKTVFAGSGDKSIRQWDLATGAHMRTFTTRADVQAIALSPEGTRLLAGGGNYRDQEPELALWDLKAGKKFADLPASGALQSAQIVPGDRAMTADTDAALRIWDIRTGRQIKSIPFPQPTKRTNWGNYVPVFCMTADANQAAVGNWKDQEIHVIDLATGAERRTLEGHSEGVTAIKCLSDGTTLVSAGKDGTLKVWDVTSGIKKLEIKAGESISALAVSPDGAMALTGHDDKSGTIKLWDIGTGKLSKTLSRRTGFISDLSISSDGRLALSGGDDSLLRFWDIGSGRQIWSRTASKTGIRSVAISADGKTGVVGSGEKSEVGGKSSVSAWDLRSGRQTTELLGEYLESLSVKFLPGEQSILAAGRLGSLRIWNPATGQVREFPPPELSNGPGLDRIEAATVTRDGKYVLSGGGNYKPAFGQLLLWETETGRLVKELAGHSNQVVSVAVSTDGKLGLSGSSDNTALVWDLARGKAIRTLRGGADTITAVELSPDAKFAILGNGDGSIQLFDLETGKETKLPHKHATSITSLRFFSSGQRLASSSSDGSAVIWDWNSKEAITTIYVSGTGEQLAITPEGFFSATSPDTDMIGIARGKKALAVRQIHQALYNPDLVREKIAGDPTGEVKKAAAILNLDKLLASGATPDVTIKLPDTVNDTGVIIATATVAEQERGGIGRIEWRINGITAGVVNPVGATNGSITATRELALDPGENTIEVVAYNGRNLLASAPVQSKITWNSTVMSSPRLYVLAIGINKYVDTGGIAPGSTETESFPPLALAVPDAQALASEFRAAGNGLYGSVHVRTVLDEEASAAHLDAVVDELAGEIGPRDTFVLYAAAHGVSQHGRFYLIPQDYQGGPNAEALAAHAIDQLKIQDWVANRIKAKKVVILLDACESGALTSGHSRSRLDGPASDAAIGRLHEATGRPVLTAAALGQSALEFGELGHGVFTSAVIDAMHRGDANSDGVVSLSELVAHVQDLVPKLVKDPKARAEVVSRGASPDEQSARFGGRGEDFPFVRRLD